MEPVSRPDATSSRVVHRLLRQRFARTAFDGEGARLYGGRWNLPGTAVVYTSPTLSLAALELFVHLEPALLPDDLVSIEARLPVDWEAVRVEATDLPPDWRSYPAPAALCELGTTWARRLETPGLWVPSAVIPGEWNLLINPKHPMSRRLEIATPVPFRFDPRMWK